MAPLFPQTSKLRCSKTLLDGDFSRGPEDWHRESIYISLQAQDNSALATSFRRVLLQLMCVSSRTKSPPPLFFLEMVREMRDDYTGLLTFEPWIVESVFEIWYCTVVSGMNYKRDLLTANRIGQQQGVG